MWDWNFKDLFGRGSSWVRRYIGERREFWWIFMWKGIDINNVNKNIIKRNNLLIYG